MHLKSERTVCTRNLGIRKQEDVQNADKLTETYKPLENDWFFKVTSHCKGTNRSKYDTRINGFLFSTAQKPFPDENKF